MILLCIQRQRHCRWAAVKLRWLIPAARSDSEELHRRQRRCHGKRQRWRWTAIAYGLLLLPHKHIVYHGAAAEHNADANENARDDRRRRMEMIERVQYDAGKEDGYRYEESTDGTRTTGTRFLQILIVPSIKHGRTQQFDGK